MLGDLLYELYKTVDLFKYGSLLYEQEAPEGEKWSQSLYEEKAEYLGSEILDKYIVNGEFLKDKLLSDIETAKKIGQSKKAYNEALKSYLEYLAETLQTSIPCKVKGTHGIILCMRSGELKDFTAKNIEAWSFSLNTSDEKSCVT